MRFPPHILDEIRARLPVSQVVGRKVALKKRGREWVGLSPFKVEKTPSFYVNDQKGFYHCFASGEHGDAFTFLMKVEGLSFPEAVERLASEAGVTLPKPQLRSQAEFDERERLLALLAASARFYSDQLSGSQGVAPRRYLEGRGLGRPTITAFGLGYAPAGRIELASHLAAQGFTRQEQALAGMLITGEDVREPYDRFRHRVMFPIADAKGRVIAFGGRALDPSVPAKYLNSPETPLFHKGHTLYNLHQARVAAHTSNRVIVVEGYMDVVALAQAGFADVVAPLGTALTAEQIGLLWRMVGEPILCFDGDSAGRKAAQRAVDTVLPLLKPGYSLRFAFLPDGLDPDDLVREQGAAAFQSVLATAQPLAQVLFDREWAAGDWSTPERRARLERELRLHISRIEDASVRVHYMRDIADRLARYWQPQPPNIRTRTGDRISRSTLARGPAAPSQRGVPGGSTAWQVLSGQLTSPGRSNRSLSRGLGHALASPSLLRSPIVAQNEAHPSQRELLLLRTLLNHVWLAEKAAEDIANIHLTSPALSRLRDEILAAVSLDNSLDSQALRSHLSGSGMAGVLKIVDQASTHRCHRFAEPDAGHAEVEAGWRHTLALHERQVGLMAALRTAEQAWHEDGDEDAFQRICALQAELQVLGRSDHLGQDANGTVSE